MATILHTFPGASSDPIDVAFWTTIYGGFTIATGGYGVGNPASLNLAHWTANSFTNDQFVRSYVSYGPGTYPVLILRGSGSSAGTENNYSLNTGSAIENGLSINKTVNGSTTLLLDLAPITPSISGHQYELRAVNDGIGGVILSAYADGVFVSSVTDSSSPHASGRIGIKSYDTAGFTIYEGGDAASPPPAFFYGGSARMNG